MNNYFTDCKTLEEAKTLYRKLSKELHPDLGGNTEEFKKMQSSYEKFVSNFMFTAWAKAESENKTGDNNFSKFDYILKKIIDFDMDIEIIGFWIYAKNSYAYKEQLKTLEFWFSNKHKAWIFSGSKKNKRATKLTEDQIKHHYGSTTIKHKIQIKRLSA